MGKIITSPVKRWPGTITIAYPMTLPQVALYQRAIIEIIEYGDKITAIIQGAVLWRTLRPLIEKWNIKKLPFPNEDNFPGYPKKAVDEFFIWFFKEINKAHKEAEEEVPKD